jgi:hypothetical protein
MKENTESTVEFRVRLPADLANRIAQLAKKERRSQNLQYIYMLESYFERDNYLAERVQALEDVIARKTDGQGEGEKVQKTRQRKAAG